MSESRGADNTPPATWTGHWDPLRASVASEAALGADQSQVTPFTSPFSTDDAAIPGRDVGWAQADEDLSNLATAGQAGNRTPRANDNALVIPAHRPVEAVQQPVEFSVVVNVSAAADDEEKEIKQGTWTTRTDEERETAKKLRRPSMMERSVTALSRSLSMAAVGDDETIKDRWDEYNAEKKGLGSFTASGVSASGRFGSASGRLKFGSGSSSVEPEGERKVAPLRTASGLPYSDLNHEKRVSRLLLWHHAQTILLSIIVAVVCIPLVHILSLLTWSDRLDIMEVERLTNETGVKQSVIVPNSHTLQIMLLVQLVFPLAIYALLLYVCMRRTWQIPAGLWIVVGVNVAWATLACALFYVYDVAFWFYYIDIFIIVGLFVPCMAAVGWYMEDDPDATVRERLNDVFFIAVLEVLVAGSTLVYCLFLMPVFFMQTSAWFHLAWLCIFHPLYFEVCTGFIVRKASNPPTL
ncbi:hypothetical protein FOA52_015845 [Chlamydomonas sp. UWO 241]|nr:hypothetical protein FOA52_015845 [Chlamydomonas sp. UWO 241]